MYMCVSMYVCTYVRMYVCVCVYVYVYIYIHIHMFTLNIRAPDFIVMAVVVVAAAEVVVMVVYAGTPLSSVFEQPSSRPKGAHRP